MTFFSRYWAYIRNNPKGYWFRRKAFGWGWVPATWEGVIVTIFSATALGFTFANISMKSELGALTHDDWVDFLTNLGITVIGLSLILFWRGEPPKWQWGIPKE